MVISPGVSRGYIPGVCHVLIQLVDLVQLCDSYTLHTGNYHLETKDRRIGAGY